ncbi:MAG: 3-hydroxybutyrate dehydrogenase [Gammaproteobacteria bacterium]|nr:3-hydroxybutyrate dehydrogenase [Gammaproteobacteria bacterium]
MDQKTALVTGGASGIGQAVAAHLARQGHRVFIADLPGSNGEAVAEEIDAEFIPADLSLRSECKSLISQIEQRTGGVDILINNAGFQHISPLEDFPEDKWDQMIGVMLTAPFLLTRYSWPWMKKQQWGRVINIASVHGQVASPYKIAYISAKHGILGMTKTAALEGGEFGITVNAICPAYVRTPLVDNQLKAQASSRGISEDEVISQVMLKNAAIKRLIEPDEIGSMVEYLISDAAVCITGTALTIDTGWTAQ